MTTQDTAITLHPDWARAPPAPRGRDGRALVTKLNHHPDTIGDSEKAAS